MVMGLERGREKSDYSYPSRPFINRHLLTLPTGLTGGLTLSIYENTAAAGSPASTSIIASPSTSIAQPTNTSRFSATITGEIVLAPSNPTGGTTLTFDCDFGDAVVGYLHVDDHIVCTTGVNSKPGQVLASTLDQPLMVLSRKFQPSNHPSTF